MNLVELDRALRQLRLSGMAAVLDTRLRQAQTEKMVPIELPKLEQHEPVKKADGISTSNELANRKSLFLVVFSGSRPSTDSLCPLFCPQ
jgi:hypothetical protein